MQKPESEPEEVASDGGAARAAGAGGAVVEAAEVQEQKQFLEKILGKHTYNILEHIFYILQTYVVLPSQVTIVDEFLDAILTGVAPVEDQSIAMDLLQDIVDMPNIKKMVSMFQW